MRIARALSATSGTAAVLLFILPVRAGTTSGCDLRDPDDPGLPGRRALCNGAALAAGVLLATNFLYVRESHALKPDILLSLAVVVVLAAMLPLARHASVRNGMLAGAAVGVGVAAKYPAVILFAPLYAAAVLGSSRRGWRRCFPAAGVWAVLAAAAVFERANAYYIPIHGFREVTRPGPHIRIYALQ